LFLSIANSSVEVDTGIRRNKVIRTPPVSLVDGDKVQVLSEAAASGG
jgi:hypothetical protein